jgi:NAD(P)-dependent dehydrogenase (short-subunit alcohol dehydrogenase family)
MARIFITGSTDGLGLAAARALLRGGHEVVLHARSDERARSVAGVGAAAVLNGDLASGAETRALADQVNALGRMDAVIHNAGVYLRSGRGETPEGHATTFAVNTLAPWLLTTLIERPARLVYLSSGLHRGGEGSLEDIDWRRRRWDSGRAYAESKLQVVALALAIARRCPDTLANAVDPGWVRTKMGGPGAPVDLETGADTQVWLAASEDPAARVSGGYWQHRRRQEPAREAADPAFQDRLIDTLADLTGARLPDRRDGRGRA